MKKNLPILLISLIFLFGCKKETIQEKQQTTSKSSRKSGNLLQSSIPQDSLIALRSEFNLQPIDVSTEDIPKVEFNSVEEARAFLNNMKNSKFEQKTIPRSSINLSKNISTLGYANTFHFYLPNASLIIGNFRFDWPSGFMVSGELTGDGIGNVPGTNGNMWQYANMRAENLKVEMYGFSFLSSYEPRSSAFQQQMTGSSQVHVRFSGILKIYVMIGESANVWNKSINSIAVVNFGPWYKDGGFEHISMERIVVQSYRTQ